MAKVTKVIAQYERVVQVKQFEPIRISFGAEVSVDPDEDAKEVLTQLHKDLRRQVHEKFLIDFEAHGIKSK